MKQTELETKYLKNKEQNRQFEGISETKAFLR